MNEDVVADLKQFIAATVSQQSAGLRADLQVDLQKLEDKIQRLDDKLTAKIDDLSASVAEALDIQAESTSSQFDDHEHRITRLEAKTA
jgi:LPS O-antigen subunit length determinant protein (WzzB/FepE family)